MVRCKYDAGAKEIRDKKLCKKSKVSRRFRHIAFWTLTAVMMMAACTSDDFVGDERLREANENAPIRLNGDAGAITRATQNAGTVAEMLDGRFKIYGTKSTNTETQKVFVNYEVWSAPANSSISNSSGWEYVGSGQVIKYWDYGTVGYNFVAGAPVSAITYNINSSTNAIESAAVTGLAGHINANPTTGSGTAIVTNPVYLARPQIVLPADYAKPVTFEFVRQQARVRVGIYETIPGYIISDIHFYANGSSTAATENNVILTSGTTGYFVGGSGVPGTITYDWTPSPPSYTYTYGSGVTTAQNWYGGAFVGSTEKTSAVAAVKATVSNEAIVANLFGSDKDMDANGFFTVLPMPSATVAAPILVKCDYTLKSVRDGSYETIEVKGATAAIPAAFSKWAPNTMYTYLFKISDNTNGYTGTTLQPDGFYPITFDAAAISSVGEMGTITTISIPSITTYQEGSVLSAGIKYVTGKPVYATVADGDSESATHGQLLPLNSTADAVGCVKVFSLGEYPVSESELQVTAPTGTNMASLGTDKVTLVTTTLPAADGSGSYYLTFTPATSGYYAIQYLTTAPSGGNPVAYTYKVVYVEAAS